MTDEMSNMSVGKMLAVGLCFVAGMTTVKFLPKMIGEAIDSANGRQQSSNFTRVQADPHLADENTTALAQAIATYGLSNDVTMQASRKTFLSGDKGGITSDLAATTTSKLASLGHSEYTLTLPMGENRVLIRNNTTGQAISLNFKSP